MNLIKSGDNRIEKILGNNEWKEEQDYRLSKFIVAGAVKDRFFVKNTFTGYVGELSDEEKRVFDLLRQGPVKGTELAGSAMEELLSQYVVIPAGQSELKQYALASFVIKNQTKNRKGITNYVILPTLACNARCVYCYEAGMTVSTMSMETAEQVVRFICRERHEGKIWLTWFGGEPLVARDVISRICQGLKEKGIPFTSKIITNGVLMTREIAQEAVRDWHLKDAQVSVDGARDDYEERKKYLAPAVHNYDALMRGIHCLLDAGVEVILRCNYDSENLAGMKGFVDDVRREFGNSEKLFFYFGMLYQEQAKESYAQSCQRMLEIRRYMDETGMHYLKKASKNFHASFHYCLADSDASSIVIYPDGELNHCEEFCENMRMGNVYDEDFKFRMAEGTQTPHEDCKDCPFLPECTPFRRNGCPDWFAGCRRTMELEAAYSFEKYARRTENGT